MDLAATYAGAEVAVTGSSGWLGSHLLPALERLGARVNPLDRSHGVDLRRPATLKKALHSRPPRLVFHLAASLRRSCTEADAVDNFATNVVGTHNLLRALSRTPPEVCLLVSTSDVYGSATPPFEEEQKTMPVTPYAASKLAAGVWARAWPGLSVIEARQFLLYGPAQDTRFFIPQVLQAAHSGQPMAMTRGEQTRDFVWVEDGVEALLRLGCRPDLAGRVFNVCTGVETSLREVVETVSSLGRPVPIQAETLPYRSGELFRIVGCPDLLEKTVDYRPRTTLREGLSRMLEVQCKS